MINIIHNAYSSLVAENAFQKTIKRPISINCSERRSHGRGVYPKLESSGMESIRIKQAKEADQKNRNVGIIRGETLLGPEDQLCKR